MRPIYTLGDYVFHKALNDIYCSVIYSIVRDKHGRIKYYGVQEYLSEVPGVEPSFLGYDGELYDSFEDFV